MDEIAEKWDRFKTRGLARHLGAGEYLTGLKEALSSRIPTIQYEGLTEDQLASFVDIVNCLKALVDKIDEHNSKGSEVTNIDNEVEDGNKGDNIEYSSMDSVITKQYNEMESNIELLTPSEVKQLLKPTEDKLLQDAAEVMNKLIKSNLRGLLFDGHIEVYFEEHSYPEQVINLLVEKLEEAGWDVELNEEADDLDVTSKYCLTLTMWEEE